MKAKELRDLDAGRARGQGPRAARRAVQARASEGDGTAREHREAALLRRDIARVETVLRQKRGARAGERRGQCGRWWAWS